MRMTNEDRSAELEVREEFRPIFGIYDEDRIRWHGREWRKDGEIRFYFDIVSGGALAGLEVIYFKSGNISAIIGMDMDRKDEKEEDGIWRGEGVYFDALRGRLNFGAVLRGMIARKIEKAARAELDEDERRERLEEQARRMEELNGAARPLWEERSKERDGVSYFGKYDETSIRRISNHWTKCGNRFYIEVDAAADFLGEHIGAFNRWYDRVYFDGSKGRFIVDGYAGDGDLEERLEKACQKERKPKKAKAERSCAPSM